MGRRARPEGQLEFICISDLPTVNILTWMLEWKGCTSLLGLAGPLQCLTPTAPSTCLAGTGERWRGHIPKGHATTAALPSGACLEEGGGPVAGERPPLWGRGICLLGSWLLNGQGEGDTGWPQRPPPLGAAPPHPSGPGLQYRPRPAEALRGGASAFPQVAAEAAPPPLPASWSSGCEGRGLGLQTQGLRVSSAAAAASAATSRSSRPGSQRSGRPPNARGRASPPRVPASRASQSRRELHKALSVVSAFKKRQVKRRLVRRQRRMMMAAAPNAHMHVKNLTMEEGVCTGKNTMHQLQVKVDAATQEESSRGPVLLSQPPELTSMPYTPETTGQQLAVSLSGELHGLSTMPSMCPSLMIQPCATIDPMLLHSQVLGPNASNQASVSATLEWQEMLEAAEALLALKNSSQTYHQPCGVPDPAGERGLQLASPTMPPRPASSDSLPSGHLDCMSLLT
ncbi:uncharacterized protein LOC119804292 [Arvicola amphibius]|uniref:uncharacterized protein LOC119804292 n=1 Tax=Arvicola amphibius TaxID=1047088 RepID=UPI001C0821FF|nr:uncharacterized protein LOC119804292 [Arvicola amphibius]